MKAETVKRDLVDKYDDKAEEEFEIGTGPDSPLFESRTAEYFVRNKVKEALALCDQPIDRTKRVLEVGCSFGFMTALLAQAFDEMTALDISPRSIQLAEARLRGHGIDNVKFLEDDAEKLANIADESFDVVFSFSTIRYCPSIPTAMKQIHRVLVPGGIAVVDFPNGSSPWHSIIKPLARMGKHIHDNLFTKDQVAAYMTEAGFKDVRVKRFLFTPRQGSDVLLPAFKTVDAVLHRVPGASAMAGIIMTRGRK